MAQYRNRPWLIKNHIYTKHYILLFRLRRRGRLVNIINELDVQQYNIIIENYHRHHHRRRCRCHNRPVGIVRGGNGNIFGSGLSGYWRQRYYIMFHRAYYVNLLLYYYKIIFKIYNNNNNIVIA